MSGEGADAAAVDAGLDQVLDGSVRRIGLDGEVALTVQFHGRRPLFEAAVGGGAGLAEGVTRGGWAEERVALTVIGEH